MPPSEPQPTSNKRGFSLFGQVAALLLALLCLANSVSCLYSAMYPSGSGEYAGLGLVFTFIINIPFCLVALLLAVLLKPAYRALRATTLIVTVVAFALPFGEPRLRKARDERHYREIMQQWEAQKPQ